jgi:hypothetical protein
VEGPLVFGNGSSSPTYDIGTMMSVFGTCDRGEGLVEACAFEDFPAVTWCTAAADHLARKDQPGPLVSHGRRIKMGRLVFVYRAAFVGFAAFAAALIGFDCRNCCRRPISRGPKA